MTVDVTSRLSQHLVDSREVVILRIRPRGAGVHARIRVSAPADEDVVLPRHQLQQHSSLEGGRNGPKDLTVCVRVGLCGCLCVAGVCYRAERKLMQLKK